MLNRGKEASYELGRRRKIWPYIWGCPLLTSVENGMFMVCHGTGVHLCKARWHITVCPLMHWLSLELKGPAYSCAV